MDIKHPEITVQLVDQDGNAFAMLARCRQSAQRAGLDKAEIDLFLAEATAGVYDHLLQTCIRWFDGV